MALARTCSVVYNMRLVHVLLTLPFCVSLSHTTTFQRIGPRIEFGGVWELSEPFAGVCADRAAAYLADPLRVLSAAWPAENIEGPKPRPPGAAEEGVTYALRQDPPITFANLVTVDLDVDIEVRSEARGGIALRSNSITSRATLRNGQTRDVPMKFELTGALHPQSTLPTAPAIIGGHFQYTTSVKLLGPLRLLPNGALRLAAKAVNDQLDLGGLFARGIAAKYPTWLEAQERGPAVER